MPGQLVHTNEILVLLGDDWFVERSANQSADIVDRRIMRKNNVKPIVRSVFAMQKSLVGRDFCDKKRCG